MLDGVRHLADTGDDETNTAGSAPDVVVNSSLAPAALRGGHAHGGHGAHGVVVLDLDGTDGRRFEHDVMDLCSQQPPPVSVIGDALK